MTARRRWLGPPADTAPASPAPDPGPAAPADASVDTAPVTPTPERPAASVADPLSSVPPARRTGAWTHWGRWVMLGLCVLAGALFAWSPETWDGYPIAVGMAVGALGAVVSVHIYGLIAWVFMRGLLRRRSWTYTRAAYSPLVLGLVLLGTLGLPAVRAGNDRDTNPTASDLRRDLNAAADDAVAAAPDPVGMKLAGQSDQLSEDDLTALNERGPLGVRFGTVITRVMADYNNQKVTANDWIASSRKRLREADKALSGLRERTRSISDESVATELRRFDRKRAQTLTAFNRLLGTVTGDASGTESQAQRRVNTRLRAYQRENQRLGDLMQPYLTDEQREIIDAASP